MRCSSVVVFLLWIKNKGQINPKVDPTFIDKVPIVEAIGLYMKVIKYGEGWGTILTSKYDEVIFVMLFTSKGLPIAEIRFTKTIKVKL
jgi:hypothetical protein